MSENRNRVLRIAKEEIESLKFPAQEVLLTKMEIEQRKAVLHRATSLGNLQKHKVLISFEDSEGLKEVYTTIWAITDNKVLLKAGRLIPVHRIYSVEVALVN
jgi:uncharacterized protein (UPF0248 family)